MAVGQNAKNPALMALPRRNSPVAPLSSPLRHLPNSMAPSRPIVAAIPIDQNLLLLLSKGAAATKNRPAEHAISTNRRTQSASALGPSQRTMRRLITTLRAIATTNMPADAPASGYPSKMPAPANPVPTASSTQSGTAITILLNLSPREAGAYAACWTPRPGITGGGGTWGGAGRAATPARPARPASLAILWSIFREMRSIRRATRRGRGGASGTGNA